ncbi:MAG: molybdopterin-dependent oxidoreductase [Ectothiorhodospiraceae bacterium]|nr:molybdopterin-dependent oxidoreductase [Ectothiorhodospiraceae bacterium]
MLAEPLRGYLLLGVEPELDCWDGASAQAAMEQADVVVAVTPFVTAAMESYADVLLPAGSFGETSGTYVNAEGRWQSFPGVTRPQGEARPAWKVLRVLGNVLQLQGFEYQSSEDVLAEVRDAAGEPAADSTLPTWTAPVDVSVADKGLIRVGSVPLYATDGLGRRATALQATRQATEVKVLVSPAVAEQHDLAELDWVEVTQNEQTARMPVGLDESLPDHVVWVPVGVEGTAGLGAQFGTVTLKRV